DLEHSAWIGLSDLLAENQYAWSDGVSPVLYTHWDTNEPNNVGGTVTSGIQPPPPTKSPCPDGYIAWYLNCYKLVEELATWNDAQDACKKQGGNLASIDMSYDQAFVAGVVLQGKADAWIGLRRMVDGSYSWSDGWPVFFTQWGPGEPTNHRQEGCVSMHASKWFHGTPKFICRFLVFHKCLQMYFLFLPLLS
uniref:C-type lectin domain-containing protein n=1 Tax=Oryzias sinensis TaxID=183150 RepID=A0A8C7XMY9_9TELE